ncbi:hypothetical protein QJS10_CPA01g02228 [Acorus calamus]|uniref:Glycoside hydrolase family 5 domain-containing protein n=1 Tax=Acorus calamus TaxID=4465 RepID=A0AAV9FJ37_ACOCL|nr:hypothetical protein QJS10_CPA01g02228 [Acorus calamus]
MEAVVPEGLSERPVAEIASLVASLGFNCVRLTYATFTWTEDDKYASLTVEGSLRSLGLTDAVEGVRRNNPSLMGLTVRDAYEKVVDALGDARLMVVLDNHVSFPMWCCADNDGNGFFGDKYFDPQVWMSGLHDVADRFKGKSQEEFVLVKVKKTAMADNCTNKDELGAPMSPSDSAIKEINSNVVGPANAASNPTPKALFEAPTRPLPDDSGSMEPLSEYVTESTSEVVGMSMRNELRGPQQNVTAWYNYVQQGAATIHTTNPNVLVIISGLKYDTDLSFLGSNPLPSNLDHKLVHEAHWYSFGKHHQWETQNPGDVCSDDTNAFDQKAGFLIRPAVGRESVPLFVSEFGVDQTGANMADNRYFTSSNFIWS